MIKRVIPILLFLFVAGCATMGIENVENLSSGHRTLVVSALGDTFRIKSLGTTIFQRWKISEDVSDWKLDKRVEALISKILQDAGKIGVISNETDEIRSLVGEIDINDYTGAREISGDMDAVTNAAKSAGADSILLLGAITINDIIFHRSNTIEGYGIYQSSFLGIKEAVNYIIFRIWLIDTNSGEDIATTLKIGKSKRDISEWLEENQQLSKEARLKIRTNFESLLDSTVEEALQELTLL